MVCMWFVCGNFDVFPKIRLVHTVNKKSMLLEEKHSSKYLGNDARVIRARGFLLRGVAKLSKAPFFSQCDEL